MSRAPTGEVRLDPSKFVPKSAWMALDLSSRRLGRSKATKNGTSGLPHAFRRRILALELTPNGESRLR